MLFTTAAGCIPGLLATFAFCVWHSVALAADAPKFVVHEWGVMITSQGDGGGTELAPPAELYTGLPPFVLRHDQSYKPTRQNHGWDKPVLHFYGQEGMRVEVRVGVPLGKPLAYWPRPTKLIEQFGKPITSRKEMMVYSLSEVTGMEWAGTLSAQPTKPTAKVDPAHWWETIRQIEGAAWFNTPAASERFLFYEATAKQEPAIRANVTDEAMVVRNTGSVDSGMIIAIVNDGATRWIATIRSIAPGASATVTKAELTAAPASDDEIQNACQTQWRSMGMSEAEAKAIVKTWKPDLLGRTGFLVCARMPTATYAKMFPLTVTPKPDELVRVGLVFDTLAGQDARMSWLPGLKPTMTTWATELADGDFRKREAAVRRFEQMGDLARPFLRELAKSPSAEAARAAAVLLEKLNAPTTKPTDATPAPVPAPIIRR